MRHSRNVLQCETNLAIVLARTLLITQTVIKHVIVIVALAFCAHDLIYSTNVMSADLSVDLVKIGNASIHREKTSIWEKSRIFGRQ
jgi:hypothetical protein